MHTSLEDHLEHMCPSCRQEHHAKFFSLFLNHMHYIVGDCEQCGYHIEFRKDDFGGGLFLPDGSAMADSFKKHNTDHMREHLEERNDHSTVLNSFSTIKMRIVPQEKKKDEKKV